MRVFTGATQSGQKSSSLLSFASRALLALLTAIVPPPAPHPPPILPRCPAPLRARGGGFYLHFLKKKKKKRKCNNSNTDDDSFDDNCCAGEHLREEFSERVSRSRGGERRALCASRVWRRRGGHRGRMEGSHPPLFGPCFTPPPFNLPVRECVCVCVCLFYVSCQTPGGRPVSET